MSAQRHAQLLLSLSGSCAAAVHQLNDSRPGTRALLRLGPSADPAVATFGRLITASMNGDEDMEIALVRVLIEHTDNTDDPTDLARVEIECFGFLSYLMQQLAKKETEAPTCKSTTGAPAEPDPFLPDEGHACSRDADHEPPHRCPCGEQW